MTSKSIPLVTKALARILTTLPASDEGAAGGDPAARSRSLAKDAARRAGAISTGLALPPGPLGTLTVLPDLVSIWKIQRQLVADVAAVYGKTASLTRESLAYCLFKHGGAALLRDVVVRSGERFLVRRAGVEGLRRLLSAVGVHVGRRALGRAVSRFVPLLGAVGVGAYAYYDTIQVGGTAIDLFSRDVAVEA